MAKMFYTAEEVAEKLGKSVEDVMEMAKRGQIQEFRDRDKVMFKVDQIDLLTGDESEPSIPLALDDSAESFAPTVADPGADEPGTDEVSEPLDLSGTGMTVLDSGASGSVIGLEDSGTGAAGAFGGSSEGETSGLLDLTRESEETSLGAELLEEVYSSDEDNVELPAASSGLFDPVDGESGGPAIVSGGGAAEPFSPMVASSAIEQLEPGWSGLAAGLLLGALLGVLGAALVVVTAAAGGAAGLASTFTGNLWAWLGGLVVAVLVCGVAGFFIGRAVD
jgi:hypothetical protein